MSIKIQFEIGHTAMLKSKKTIDNFTHDWELYVKGIDKADISAFIDKIVFNLHESFPKPKRTVKDPPYIIKESGYAGFIIPIDIYFKNRQMQKFTHDLELQQNGPPVHKSEIMKYIFENPSDDFRQKLIKGGGIYINNDEKNRDSSDEYKQLLNKPKFSSDSSTSSKKHKIRQDKNKEPTFANLFGTPIQKQQLPSSSSAIPTTNNTGIILGNSGSNSNSNSKVSPDPKSKSSPIVGSSSLTGTLTANKTNSSNSGKIDKGYNSGQITSNLVQQSTLSTGGINSNNNNKDKYEKSEKKDKQNKHNSPHKDKSSSSSNIKDNKKDDKHDRRNDRKKDKSHSKERDRSREKNSKQSRPPSPPQLKPQQQQHKRIASPILPRKLSPLRNSNKEDGHNSNKNKSNSSGNGSGIDLDTRKSESKKSKKDKKSHDKDKVRDRREKERSSSSTNDTQKNKDSHHTTAKLTTSLTSNKCMDNTGGNLSTQINNDTNKLDYNKSKEAGSITKNQSIKKSDNNKFPTDNYQPASANPEKKTSENLDKDEKRHKHKKKDKTKDKEKSSSRLNKDDSTKKNKDIENINTASGSNKNQKYSNNNLQIIQSNNDTVTNITNTTINNNAPSSLIQQPIEPELSESESIINSDMDVQTTETIIKQQKITNHSDSSTNSYKDLVQQSRLKSLQSQQLSGAVSPITTIIPTTTSNNNNNNNKKERKSKENKKIDKEDKKRKRKSREESDLIIAPKKPNSPTATSSNLSADQQQTSIPKYLKKTDIKIGTGVSGNDSSGIYSSTIQQDSFRTPTNNISTSSSTSSHNNNNNNNNINSNNNFHNRNSGIGSNNGTIGSTVDYMSELRELQKKIMTLQDSTELQQVVEMIAATGRYEVTSKTFDFDLCALDRNTVQRLQDFFAATSVS